MCVTCLRLLLLLQHGLWHATARLHATAAAFQLPAAGAATARFSTAAARRHAATRLTATSGFRAAAAAGVNAAATGVATARQQRGWATVPNRKQRAATARCAC
jgi:hypothetical protein